MVAVSGHVKRPGVFEIVNGTTTFRDLIYGEDFCGGIRDGHELKAFVPGGGSAPWFVPDQLDLPVRGQASSAPTGRCSAPGAVMVMDETTDIPAAALTLLQLLRPRVVRQVRAVPRGRHVAVADHAAHRRRRRHRGRPRSSCSRSASRSARATSRTRRARRLGLCRPAVPVQDDHDLLRRPVGVRARALGAHAVPRRVPTAVRPVPVAPSHPRGGSEPELVAVAGGGA